MQARERTFEELSTQIAVVTFEAAPRVRAYVEDTGVPWPILIDGARTVYQAYGMGRGTLWDVWSPQTWKVYLRELLRHGNLPKTPRADTLQLGGDVLIDPAGIVRFHQIGRGPADRPSIDTLLRARTEQERSDVP